jgi:hypothetical protein
MGEQGRLEHPFILKPDEPVNYHLERDIEQRREEMNFYDEAIIFTSMQGIVNALALAQSYDRKHPDISPLYIVETNDQWKISFDAATKQNPNYKSPQEIMQEEFNPYKSGVFSLGLIFLEMASLKTVENLNLPGKLNEIYERVNEI